PWAEFRKLSDPPLGLRFDADKAFGLHPNRKPLASMSQPLRMHQIRRILELDNDGQSIHQIKRLTGLSRNTVKAYLRRIAASGLSIRQAMDLEDDSLAAIVYP